MKIIGRSTSLLERDSECWPGSRFCPHPDGHQQLLFARGVDHLFSGWSSPPGQLCTRFGMSQCFLHCQILVKRCRAAAACVATSRAETGCAASAVVPRELTFCCVTTQYRPLAFSGGSFADKVLLQPVRFAAGTSTLTSFSLSGKQRRGWHSVTYYVF